ncbi:hypothetical protein AYM40_09205 [Paraburkholderia phytofirmans OLGA172]|uniref:Uncharacterized protein n=1 Tax=Paraburkholderia phytofirmans OLGA172 TaxID=1417228 RepID=A0A160FJM4_9BURK|nr:hypothetical protein AYM40_09205 [Paraburkholderia phytofirmans OLGA172]
MRAIASAARPRLVRGTGLAAPDAAVKKRLAERRRANRRKVKQQSQEPANDGECNPINQGANEESTCQLVQ